MSMLSFNYCLCATQWNLDHFQTIIFLLGPQTSFEIYKTIVSFCAIFVTVEKKTTLHLNSLLTLLDGDLPAV